MGSWIKRKLFEEVDCRKSYSKEWKVSQVASISCVHDLFLFKKWMHSEFANQFFGNKAKHCFVLTVVQGHFNI